MNTRPFDFPLFAAPTVETSTGSYGRWAIRLSEVTIRFFWRRAEAEAWLSRYLAADADGRESMAHG